MLLQTSYGTQEILNVNISIRTWKGPGSFPKATSGDTQDATEPEMPKQDLETDLCNV